MILVEKISTVSPIFLCIFVYICGYFSDIRVIIFYGLFCSINPISVLATHTFTCTYETLWYFSKITYRIQWISPERHRLSFFKKKNSFRINYHHPKKISHQEASRGVIQGTFAMRDVKHDAILIVSMRLAFSAEGTKGHGRSKQVCS